CTAPVNEQSAEATGSELMQEETTAMPGETLSAELQQTILQAVGEQQNLSPETLQIASSEAADWPDACLGIPTPDVMCAQMITPGWAVAVTDGQQTWQYRTDLDATQVKLDTTQ
ncbi:MAG: hypothetical protein AAFN08_14655, partial [Cyanobacteria bacterium J06559_3]